MSRYKRLRQRGGCYFFTLVTYKRRPLFSTSRNVERLREAVLRVKNHYPFSIDGIVILPDHLHCIWRLPQSDDDNAVRWGQIKRHFSLMLDEPGEQEFSRPGKRERAVWQSRFWEHLIIDESDWRRHMDYIHYNPVKHGLVEKVRDWPHSSFLRCVHKGWYALNWGENVPEDVLEMDVE